jgi:hypothetical protein
VIGKTSQLTTKENTAYNNSSIDACIFGCQGNVFPELSLCNGHLF